MVEAVLVSLILFMATLVSSTFGFGSALFAMPLLTLVLGLQLATPLFGLVGPTIAAIILVTNWQRVEFASTWRLIVATLLGIPVGVYLLKALPSPWIIHTIGVLLMLYGCYRLTGARLPQVDSPYWAFPFGFVAGVLGGAYNTNGPPTVVYGNMRHWPPDQFRATLQGYFLPTGVGILASHGLGGLWTFNMLQLYAISLPGILIAIWLGGWCNQNLPIERFQVLLSVLLVGLGAMLWI
ncbi:MAG: sulfite exporter TauE/SafE family protein [Leptolyngbya sp. RL_3_1]|nr:sulfite exporter TauE/SafE family protein [Leptolyngbya sp. RL_3_1]